MWFDHWHCRTQFCARVWASNSHTPIGLDATHILSLRLVETEETLSSDIFHGFPPNIRH